MQYKGEDLDLRVPVRASREVREHGDYDLPLNGRWPRPHWGSAHEPIWVDEIVLQCCNYAFDIAVAHAAAEVGLEHLVHALTRVDAAARILEARGVREGQLRRESAALLASEIPTTQVERSAPRRSPDMEDVLRRATEVSARRGHAANVDDVLWTILNYGRDVPAVALLRRMTPDWQRPEWGRGREAPEPRAEPVRVVPTVAEAVLPRMAAIEDGVRALLAELASERKSAAQRIGALEDSLRTLHAEWTSERRIAVAPRIAAIEDGIRSLQAELGGERKAMSDLYAEVAGERRLNIMPRIAAIEDGLRALHAEIGGERKAAAELIRDIQRDIVAQRGDQASFRGDLSQRLEGLERGMQVRGDMSRIPAQMADRMAALEKAVHAGLGEGARNWAALGQRLQTLEAAISDRAGGTDADALLQRLAGFETLLEARAQELAQGSGAATDRLAAIERVVAASAGEGGRHWAALSERLGHIEAFLKSRGPDGDSADMKVFVERLGGLERAVRAGFGESMRVTGELRDRVGAVEGIARQAAAPAVSSAAADEALLFVDERIGALTRTFEQRLRESDGVGGEVAQRLRAIEARLTDGSALQQVDVAHLAGPLADRITSLQEEATARTTEIGRLVEEATRRVVQLEEASRTGQAATDEALKLRDREIQDMHDAIVRLAENQHTLASAIADWRHEVHADFGTVNTQIERAVQQAAVAAAAVQPATRTSAAYDDPVVMPAATRRTDGQVARIVRTVAEPDTPTAGLADIETGPRARSFWYWLFGTPSVSAANRDAGMRFERLQQQLRDARERRRGEA